MYASPTRSRLISALVHAAVFALLILTGKVVKILPPLQDHGSIILPSDLVKYRVTRTESGRSGGGQHDPDPPQLGHPPKFSTHPFVPPTARIENQQPVLSMDMAVFGDPAILIPAVNLSLIGDPKGVANVISGGPGGPTGIGKDGNGGVGSNGGHTCCGTEGDRGGLGGLRGAREAVTEPRLLTKVDPEYSEEARKSKVQGSVLLRVVINERGLAESIEVTQGLGLGLDERAIEAVKKWTFRPAMRGKVPVPVSAIVQVTFRLL
jgi:TonB family protein